MMEVRSFHSLGRWTKPPASLVLHPASLVPRYFLRPAHTRS